MIEQIENTLQIAVLLVCVAVALALALRLRSRPWILLALFFGSWLMGDIYWLVCLIFFGSTPSVSIVADLSWYASYMFLFLLLQLVVPLETGRGKRILPWIGPLFAAGMAVFFMQWGEIVGTLICAVLMAMLFYAAIDRLASRDVSGAGRLLSLLALLFCVLEYGLWVASCYWLTDTLAHPYYWFDLTLTVLFPFFLPVTKKAVAA